MNVENFDDTLLLISVKPEYATKIFKGEKTVELRKSAPQKAKKGTHLLIYVTSPIKELRGICIIENIIKATPQKLWKKVGNKTGITYNEYIEYYKEHDNAPDFRSFLKNNLFCFATV